MSLWVEAARDAEAERASLRMVSAKVSVATLWPFLSLAGSLGEFEHRLALAAATIAARVPADLLEPVVASLREDYLAVQPTPQPQLPQPAPAPVLAARHEQPSTVQLWHVGAQQWITVQAKNPGDAPDEPSDAGQSNANPYYFSGGPEQGPRTEEGVGHGNFPVEPGGPDPYDPVNDMFPMQPTRWTAPSNARWVDRPMNLSPANTGYTSRRRNAVGGPRYMDEGVETGRGPNPDYFSGGSEGIAGDSQDGFPEDLAAGVDPTDDRVNNYGAVPPQQSSGSGPGQTRGYSNREGVRHTSPGGGEHAPYRLEEGDGGWYVVNEKGERKNKDPKSHDEARQLQKALYKNVPGARESAEEDEEHKASARGRRPFGREQFYDPADPSVRVVGADMSGDGYAGQANPFMSGDTNVPTPPPAMMPGGAGSTAIPPGGDPGATPATTPPRQMPSSGGGMGGGMAGGMGGQENVNSPNPPPQRTGALLTADNVRERPSDTNPYGTDDPFAAKNWDAVPKQRPRQPLEGPGGSDPNTPQNTRMEPIPTSSSSDLLHQQQGVGRVGDDEEEDDRQQAARVAARVVAELMRSRT